MEEEDKKEAARSTTGSKDDEPDSEAARERDPLVVLSDQFSARIEGFRELLEVISPHVAALDEPQGIEFAIEKSELSSQGKDIVRDIFVGAPEEKDAVEESAGDEPSRQGETGLTKEFTELVRKEPSGMLRVLRRFAQGVIVPRSSLLHGSLLTVAVASFEFLLAGLYGQHLIQFPKQLDDDEKEFSLADLSEIGSIEEAQRVLAERRVDGFMRRGIDDWSKWSKKTLGQSFEELCMDPGRFTEVLQRRHIVVHSGGIVNRLYLERVSLPAQDQPKLGEELAISATYMGSALDELEVLGYGLAALAWAKWDREKPDNASVFLNSRIYDLLKGKRFRLARKLAEVGDGLGQSDAYRWTVKVNGWIATKRMDGLEACRSSISDWDVTALSNDFKLAKACLLDESEKAFRLLVPVIQEAEAPGSVWDWPLLDDLRDDSRFDAVFAEAGYAPPNRQGTDEQPIRPASEGRDSAAPSPLSIPETEDRPKVEGR
jgi:hypothetical protein